MKYLNDENFEVMIGKGIWLVDFYADWCGPCKMMGPILEGLNGVNILKVNVDKREDLARKFSIMSIPTLIFFKDGKEVKKVIGFTSQDEIEKVLENI